MAKREKALVAVGLVYLFLSLLGEPRRRKIMDYLNSLPASPAQPPKELAPPVLDEPKLFSLIGLRQVRDTSSAKSTKPEISIPLLEPDFKWRQVIILPAVLLILGKRGSGKSALGYRLLELFRYFAQPYVVDVPKEARSILPEWIGIASTLEDVPPKSIVLVDEAYLHYHARSSTSAEARAMSQILNLSRQREQTLIFVTQEARQVDKNIASSASAVIFKDLGILQLSFDRPELSGLAAQAREALGGVSGDRRRSSFVYAPDSDFIGLLSNELPSFWRSKLSHLYRSESAEAHPRPARRTTAPEKVAKAKALKSQGYSLNEIATTLGVSKGTVVNYLRDYPYKKPGR